ncbi:uncharacterized protein K444DRAFT_405806 [Hyaloscypha bicolor E]|uniref:Uncharacterized protein n=1 Tax=Hyaloscypha bicolor E TaxID=1095630 RepID=A0A2J6T9B1_9HELO|nr:uncharacterized protein K444DRAFT_405806 [Hyaloscypha bicolor E]PMD59543.1 hypothetical protein K444DRAFT_405806 [Hyaloscypha bicolor E]
MWPLTVGIAKETSLRDPLSLSHTSPPHISNHSNPLQQGVPKFILPRLISHHPPSFNKSQIFKHCLLSSKTPPSYLSFTSFSLLLSYNAEPRTSHKNGNSIIPALPEHPKNMFLIAASPSGPKIALYPSIAKGEFLLRLSLGSPHMLPSNTLKKILCF